MRMDGWMRMDGHCAFHCDTLVFIAAEMFAQIRIVLVCVHVPSICAYA